MDKRYSHTRRSRRPRPSNPMTTTLRSSTVPTRLNGDGTVRPHLATQPALQPPSHGFQGHPTVPLILSNSYVSHGKNG